MFDIEKVFWTILLRMASRVFLFFTPSDSSLVRNWFVCREPRTPVVKLGWEAFQPLFSRLLGWFMKPRWELHLSFFSCSLFSAQSSFVYIALVYSKNTHFPCQRLGHPASGLWKCLCLYRRSRWRRRCGILRCLFGVWPCSGPLLVGGSHAAPYIPKSYINPTPHELLGLGLKESAIGVPMHRLVQKRISVSRTSIPSIFHGEWLFVGVVEPGSSIVYVPRFRPSLGVSYIFVLIIFFTESTFDLVEYAPLFKLEHTGKVVREAL